MDIASGLSGIPVVQSATARALLFPTPTVHQRVQNLDTGRFERWDGATWRPEGSMQALPVFNVQASPYNAVGDGVTDDAAAIQAAATAASDAGGGVVLFPPGTYLIGTRIDLSGLSYVTFEGAGAGVTILKPKLNPDASLPGFQNSIFSSFPEPNVVMPSYTVFAATKLTWRHMTFDMDYDTIPDAGVSHTSYGTGPNAHPADNYQYPIYAFFVDGVTVEWCEFKNCWYNGVEVYCCNVVRVHDNVFSHVGDKANYLANYCCIEIDGYCHDVRVVDNTCDDVGYGLLLNANAPQGNPDGIVGTRDCYFERNTIRTVAQYAIGTDGTVRRLFIRGNSLADVQRGAISVNFTQSGQADVLGAHIVRVSGNTVDGYNLALVSGICAIETTAADCTIDDNTIVNTLAAHGANNYYGIIARQLTELISAVSTDTGNVTIAHNRLRGGFSNAYAIRSFAKQTTASDNRIVDSYGDSVAAMGVVATDSVELHNRVAWSSTRGSPTVAAGSGLAPIHRVSADRGDASVTLKVGVDDMTQRYATNLTTNRSISLSTAGATNGDRFRLVFTAGGGPNTLNFHGLKTFTGGVAAWGEAEFDGTTWRLIGYGTL